jgi:hypothetical protein
MIGSNYVWVRGPSIWRIDNYQGDSNFTRHNTDAALLNLNVPNCKRNNTLIATGNEKIICCNRKDRTFFGFLRYSDSSPTIETQISIYQNGNKIYFNDSKAQRIDMHIMFDMGGPSFGILYKYYLIVETSDQPKHKMYHTTLNCCSGDPNERFKVYFENRLPHLFLHFCNYVG